MAYWVLCQDNDGQSCIRGAKAVMCGVLGVRSVIGFILGFKAVMCGVLCARAVMGCILGVRAVIGYILCVRAMRVAYLV